MVKIYVDPGHGGNDPGAVGNGLREKDLTLAISLKIRNLLQKYEGVQVRLSRTIDKTLTLKQRTDDANAWGADYLLSIHINAFNGSARGYEDYIYSGLSDSSQTAQYRDVMHEEITKVINLPNRGKKKANFHMLRESRMSAMLSENGFIDNAQDAALLKQDSFLNSIAEGHVNGLVKIFNLKKKSQSNKKPSKESSSYIGKRVESHHRGKLRFYNKPSWEDKDVMGHLEYGYGFPTIIDKVKVGNGYQYKVKNSKGDVYYVTAHEKYVHVE